MQLTLDVSSGQVKINELIVDKGFRDELLKDVQYQPYNIRIGETKPPVAEYIVTPVALFNWNFTIILRFENGVIVNVTLLWMDSDLASRDNWEEIVKADLVGDFKKLFKFISSYLPDKPTKVSNNNAQWKYPWGSVSVWSEDRSFTEGILISWT